MSEQPLDPRRAPEASPDPEVEQGERHPLAKMLLTGVVAAIIVTAGALSIDWFPKSASGSAHKIDTLYDVLLIASVPIFVLVMTVAIYSVIKFRARPGDTRDGAPIHGHTMLEIVWVAIPFLLVTGLAIYGWVVLNDIEAKQPNELVVNVTGQQFIWNFDYPGQQVRSQELVLPKDRPVHFRIHTKDVIHSFWVPEFRLKSDAVPGLTTDVRLTPDRLGHYQVVCAELCGLGHPTMRADVRVVPRTQFASWVTKSRKGPARAGGGADGKQVFASSGCGACHTFAPAGSTAKVGPRLDGLQRSAAAFAKARKESVAQYVMESIVNPRAFTVPGFPKTVMPTTFKSQLSDAQVKALVQYLLGGGKG
ncbi:MAG: cytochrome c oxidase subunit II [Thermoleophilaceae bacterium]